MSKKLSIDISVLLKKSSENEVITFLDIPVNAAVSAYLFYIMQQNQAQPQKLLWQCPGGQAMDLLHCTNRAIAQKLEINAYWF